MLKVLRNTLLGALAIALFLAIAGAVLALVGSIGGFPDLKQVGGSLSALGVLCFFAAILVFGFVSRMRPMGQHKVDGGAG
ncbi:hypothetical protein [Mesorhizobium sp. Cs1299R1N3]|uniref:hypothetical protein n=1 Tax=Mesorhizobium sp. Cs1299R1N3 TaxID=3015173 RepID=UPI00301DEDFA